jgi:hypothetical protein
MTALNLRTIATIAAALVASSTWAAGGAEQKCGAGTCGKKESTCKPGTKCDASCSKKDSGCSKKDAACSKKDAACSKK